MLNLHNELRSRQSPAELARSLSCVDKMVANSNYIRDWTRRTYSLPEEKVRTILNGVDPEQFHERPESLEADGSPLRVLFIGRIDPNKGPDVAVDAVAQLREQGLPVEMSVAGAVWFYKRPGDESDPFALELQEKMRLAGAEPLGHVPRADVPALIREHDVVCVPSRANEPFGLVVLEAMASGCAVIASDRGGLPEACGGAAMLINPDNLDEMTSSLRLLATDAEQLRAWKRKAVERAARGTWAEHVRQLEDVLQEVTRTRSAPRQSAEA